MKADAQNGQQSVNARCPGLPDGRSVISARQSFRRGLTHKAAFQTVACASRKPADFARAASLGSDISGSSANRPLKKYDRVGIVNMEAQSSAEY